MVNKNSGLCNCCMHNTSFLLPILVIYVPSCLPILNIEILLPVLIVLLSIRHLLEFVYSASLNVSHSSLCSFIKQNTTNQY